MKTGQQKKAREKTLVRKIREYIQINPGATSSAIASSLSVEGGLKNYGLTPRKIGFIIPRLFEEEVVYGSDTHSGKRCYYLRSQVLPDMKGEELTYLISVYLCQNHGIEDFDVVDTLYIEEKSDETLFEIRESVQSSRLLIKKNETPTPFLDPKTYSALINSLKLSKKTSNLVVSLEQKFNQLYDLESLTYSDY